MSFFKPNFCMSTLDMMAAASHMAEHHPNDMELFAIRRALLATVRTDSLLQHEVNRYVSPGKYNPRGNAEVKCIIEFSDEVHQLLNDAGITTAKIIHRSRLGSILDDAFRLQVWPNESRIRIRSLALTGCRKYEPGCERLVGKDICPDAIQAEEFPHKDDSGENYVYPYRIVYQKGRRRRTGSRSSLARSNRVYGTDPDFVSIPWPNDTVVEAAETAQDGPDPSVFEYHDLVNANTKAGADAGSGSGVIPKAGAGAGAGNTVIVRDVDSDDEDQGQDQGQDHELTAAELAEIESIRADTAREEAIMDKAAEIAYSRRPRKGRRPTVYPRDDITEDDIKAAEIAVNEETARAVEEYKAKRRELQRAIAKSKTKEDTRPFHEVETKPLVVTKAKPRRKDLK